MSTVFSYHTLEAVQKKTYAVQKVLMGLITKTSYDFLYNYLKLDHKSIVSSQLTV